MSGPADSPFRGYSSIAEIVTRLRPLAEFYLSHKPDTLSLTLARRDFDLIRRWPQAAEMHGFAVAQDGGLTWHGFVLLGDDHSKSRDFKVKHDNGVQRYALTPGSDPALYPREPT
jgi:hypothetical protein